MAFKSIPIPLKDFGILLLYGSPIAVILGSLHYAVLRLMVKRGERNGSKRELRVGLTLTIALCVTLGFFVSLHRRGMIRESECNADIWNDDSSSYAYLANTGQYDELVREMETDCERFTQAKQALDGDFRVGSANYGLSYLCGSLMPVWESTSRLAPSGVLIFLQDACRGSDKRDNAAYGPWRPIAEKTSQSKIPIIRAMGCYLLDDYDGFAEASYLMAYSDPDAIPLAAFAALKDPNRARSVMRFVEYWPSGTYQEMRGVDSHLLAFTARALDEGLFNEEMKEKLRAKPWTRKLSIDHQKALGLVVEGT